MKRPVLKLTPPPAPEPTFNRADVVAFVQAVQKYINSVEAATNQLGIVIGVAGKELAAAAAQLQGKGTP